MIALAALLAWLLVGSVAFNLAAVHDLKDDGIRYRMLPVMIALGVVMLLVVAWCAFADLRARARR